jgi:hypothetical protein
MDSRRDDEQPAELELDEDVDERRAAFVLGRNIRLIQGWLTSVHSIASIPERPWEWEHPDTIFGLSFDSMPSDLISEINDSLFQLTRSRAVNAAVLVELHRALDDATELCVAIAKLAQYDQRDELCELYWISSYDLSRAMDLESDVLKPHSGILEAWRRFGDLLGKALYFLGQYFDPTDLPDTMKAILDLGPRLLPPMAMDELDRLVNSIELCDSGDTTLQTLSRINNELIDLVQQLDARAIENLQATASTEPYLVLDDEQQVVIFLGTRIPFEDFHRAEATGGLKLLRVLMEDPGKHISAKELIEKSGLGIDVNTLYAYMARFRKVISRAKTNWPGIFKDGPDAKLAEAAFIIAKRGRRKLAEVKTKSDPEGPQYKLDLPASRIRHIERVRA